MANAINDPPNEYTFGTEFNYALWTKDTRVSLHNVPWNNDYRDIVKFADKTALNTYLDSLEASSLIIENVSYLKPGVPIRVGIPFGSVYRYNYLRASNGDQPVAVGADVRKDFYYFITDVRYIAPDTTEIVLQLDVWQTFGYDITFGNSYVERGHIGIANENAFNSYGRDYLTIPEGLDIGAEYVMVTKNTEQVMTTSGDVSTAYNVLAVSAVDLDADPGTVGAPVLVTADPTSMGGVMSGASLYMWETTGAFAAFLVSMKDKPWVTQGILGVYIIPPIKRYDSSFAFDGSSRANGYFTSLLPKKYAMLTAWRDSTAVVNYIPSRYRGLKKFLTYPYCVIELTNFTGKPIILKPDSWADDDASIVERVNMMPPDQRVVFSPYKYNAIAGSPDDTFGDNGGDDNGEFIDVATMISNFPTLAIVNDGAISYLAANKNQIAFQYQDASWAQQRALRGNEVTYDQATSGMNLANELTQTGIRADTQQTDLNNYTAQGQATLGAVGSVAGGVLGAAGNVGGGPAGALGAAGSIGGGALQAAMGISALAWQQNQNTQSLGIRNAAANQANRQRVGNMGYIRDTNKNLADWAAKGDYENRIAGINAKVQDAHLIQPTTSGQIGGDTFNLINNTMVVSLRIKMIDQANIRAVGEYWLRYGYAVRKFLTPPSSLMVMSKFTYWKLLETYVISAPMPETFKQTIRGIFEKGVTVWADPADIGVIDIADNEPLTGVSF